MNAHALMAVAAAILTFGVISRRAERTILTAPIYFVAMGLMAAALGLINGGLDEKMLHTLAELTLMLVLFTDASRIQLRGNREGLDLPARLLLIGLPLCIAMGCVAGALLFPHFTLWEAALLAAVLAPTDAALGQAVVSSSWVPVRIRQTLNIESGLNDGIALPVVLVFLSACASAQPDLGGTAYWLRFATLQITLGPLVGFAVGWLGTKVVQKAADRNWMSIAFQHLSSLGLALLAFAAAETVGGNGFIAVFIAGLALGNLASEQLRDCLHDFGEAEGQLLTLLVFLAFGAFMLPDVLPHIGPRTVLYAVASLTIIRMLPVAIALIGKRLAWPTVVFLGWFGPRGVASILFGLLVVERSGLQHSEEIFVVVLATVLLSVIAHGITSYPGTRWYAGVVDDMGSDRPEHKSVADLRVRIQHGDS